MENKKESNKKNSNDKKKVEICQRRSERPDLDWKKIKNKNKLNEKK